jgi:pimeloyl-ACP methyl ester carboxylesterase
MDPVNVKELEWALAGEETLARELEREAQTFLARVDADPTALFEGIELSDSDRAVLSDPAFRASSGVTTKEMFAGGVWGWVDDDLACIKPWGFELAELRVPVEVRYGAGDVLVPARHGEWLAAHIPGAVVHVDEDRGHLLTPDERLRMLQAFALA